MVDAYHQPYVPFYLATREFFRLVREHLAPGGIVALNVAAVPDDRTLVRAVGTTLAAELPQVLEWPALRFNTIVLGLTEPLVRAESSVVSSAARPISPLCASCSHAMPDRSRPPVERGPTIAPGRVGDGPDDRGLRSRRRSPRRGLPPDEAEPVISLERRDGRPLRIGHRGAAALAPENTLRSFRAAVEVGVDLVEFDVLDLRSGELVIAHSNDLREVSHGAAAGTVRDRSLQNLKEICGLPTLEEALAFFADEARHVGLHLDLKTCGREANVAAAIRRFDLVERSFVSSFSFRTARSLARIDPDIRVGITVPRGLLGITERGRGAVFARVGLSILRWIAPFAAPRPRFRRATALVLHHSVVGETVVRRAHARGAVVVAWTVDDPRDLARVDEAGVDAVVSNDPRIFASTLET